MPKYMQARRRAKKPMKKKPWTVKKAGASNCNPVGVTEQADAKLPWYLNMIPSVWLRFTVRNTVNAIVNAFISLYLWSNNSVKKHLLLVKNLFAPSFICQRELRTLRQRLHKLESEFLKLQSALQNTDTSITVPGNQCCCSCRQTTSVCSIKESIVQAVAENPFPSLPPPPPPLPPPPPPPVPPPTFLLLKHQPVLKKAESTRPPKAAPARQEGPIPITLKDLLNVKLRKARDNIDRQKMGSHRSEYIPLISLSELQAVNLKMGSKMPPKRLTNIFKDTVNKSPLEVRRHLRKVNMVRSPGGTPLYDRNNKENGTGLTPLMTKALRQKFQLAHPKSPSPLRLSPLNQGL
ncbi:proline-rich protein 11 isoform X2 [Mixophyes fleayi]